MNILILALLALIIGSLVLSGIVHKRHQKMEQLRAQIRKALSKASASEDLFDDLTKSGISADLLKLFGRHWIATLRQAQQLSPTDLELIGAITAGEEKLRVALTEIKEPEPAMNDTEIKDQQRCLSKALGKLKQFFASKQISQEEYLKWDTHIKTKYIDVIVEAHVAQAKRCEEENERATASTHYRAAQNVLTQSQVHGPEKKIRLSEISDLSKKLYSVDDETSTNTVDDTNLNPTPTTDNPPNIQST